MLTLLQINFVSQTNLNMTRTKPRRNNQPGANTAAYLPTFALFLLQLPNKTSSGIVENMKTAGVHVLSVAVVW